MSRFSGMGIDRAAKAFIIVDLPEPLGPKKPYLLVARLEKAALVVIATFKTRIMPNKHTKLLLLLFLLLLLLCNEFIVCVVAICIMRD